MCVAWGYKTTDSLSNIWTIAFRLVGPHSKKYVFIVVRDSKRFMAVSHPAQVELWQLWWKPITRFSCQMKDVSLFRCLPSCCDNFLATCLFHGCTNVHELYCNKSIMQHALAPCMLSSLHSQSWNGNFYAVTNHTFSSVQFRSPLCSHLERFSLGNHAVLSEVW